MEGTVNHELFSASVHPLEINVDQPTGADATPPDTDSLGTVAFRHSGWTSWRNRVTTALANTQQKASRQEAFAACGSHAWLSTDPADPTKFRVACDRCHDRFCLPCANELARRTSRIIAEFIADKELRFITLTLKTDDEGLEESLTRLIASFRRLRNRQFWQRHVFGGASFVEIKWNAQSNRWHPHLHTIATGRYMPVADLKQEWFQATGDSYIVDIRPVKSNDRAAEYLAKYASKGYNSSIFHDKARLEEAIVALAGKRLMMCFGNWRGFSIAAAENEERWTPVAPLSHIRQLASLGSKWAQRLMQHLADPENYHTPGPMPPAECIKLGRPPPDGSVCPGFNDPLPVLTIAYAGAHPHAVAIADDACFLADENARDRAVYNGFAVADHPRDAGRWPMTAKAASMLPVDDPRYAPLPRT